MVEPRSTTEVSRPRLRALLWALGLLRYAWLPFTFTIVGRWVGSIVQIGAAALLAFAVAQMNLSPAGESAVLPDAVTKWLTSTNHPSLVAALAALAAGICSGILDTLVSWSGSWIHVLLNRRLTPAAVASALQGYDGAGSTIDSSTLIQRWLLKEVLVDFFQSGVASGIGAIGTIVLVLAATFRTNSQAFGVCAICLGLWTICCVALTRKAITASREAAIQHELMGRVLRSTVALRRDLSRPSYWRFWLQRTEQGKNDLGRSILWQGIWAANLSGALGIMASSIPLIALIVALSSGGLQAAVAVYLFTSRLVSPLTEISQALTVFQDQLVAIQRTHDAFAGALDFQTSGHYIPNRIASLEFDGGAVKFNGSGVLDLPLVRAQAGRLTYLVGPSGSGKSSLLAVLAGQRLGSTGELRVDGNRIDLLSLSWRENVSLLPQYPELLPGSVNDNLNSFPGWIPSRCLAEAVDAILQTTAECEAPEVEFSAGQRRTIAMLRVLGSNAPVILLDEPLTGVDNGLVKHLRPAISEVAANRIVIIALHEHDLVRLDLPASVVNLSPKGVMSSDV